MALTLRWRYRVKSGGADRAHQQRDKNWMKQAVIHLSILKNCHRLLATKASPMKATRVIAPSFDDDFSDDETADSAV